MATVSIEALAPKTIVTDANIIQFPRNAQLGAQRESKTTNKGAHGSACNDPLERYMLHVLQVLDPKDQSELVKLMLRLANNAYGGNFNVKLGRLFRIARERGIKYEDYKLAAGHE